MQFQYDQIEFDSDDYPKVEGDRTFKKRGRGVQLYSLIPQRISSNTQRTPRDRNNSNKSLPSGSIQLDLDDKYLQQIDLNSGSSQLKKPQMNELIYEEPEQPVQPQVKFQQIQQIQPVEEVKPQKQKMISNKPAIKIEQGELELIPTYNQIQKTIRELNRKFKNQTPTVLQTLQQSLKHNSLQSFIDTHNNNHLNRQLLKFYVSDRTVKETCSYLSTPLSSSSSVPPNSKISLEQLKSLQTVEIIRQRLSQLFRKAILKFNKHAIKLIRNEKLQQIQLNDEQINKIIMARSASGNEVKQMLGQYFLLDDPNTTQFHDLKKKLHNQLKPMYEH